MRRLMEVLWRDLRFTGRMLAARPGWTAAAVTCLAIATGDGLLLPLEVQPENRKAMPWADFLRGARLSAGARVTEPTP